MIVSVSAVSAAEDIADSTDLAASDDSTPLEVDEAIDDVQADPESTEPVETGNFTALQTLINEGGNNVTLDKDYTRVVDENDIEITKDFTIDGQGKYTIDAKSLGGIFKVNEGKTLTLKGLTLTNGQSDEGAAVYVYDDAKLNVDNVKFVDNAANKGGAISSYGIVVIDNSLFDGNALTDKMGEGLAIYSEGTLTINNTEFTNNPRKLANRTNGDQTSGVIANVDSDLYVYNSNFTNNSAIYGGVICSDSEVDASTVVDNCRFIENTGYSGGVISTYGVDLTVKDSYFEANVAYGDGSEGYTAAAGAIYVAASTGNNKISASTFKNNKAHDGANPAGGAILLEDSCAVIYDCEFDGNYASGIGGAIAISKFDESVDVTITKSNFTNNKADNKGGAIFSMEDSKLKVSESKFEGNTAENGTAIFNKGDLTVSNNTFGENDKIESETEVSKDGSKVTIDPIANVTYGNPVVINIKIENRTNNVTVSVDHIDEEGMQPDIENLNYTIEGNVVTIYGLDAGEYKVQIANIGDNNYETDAEIELFNVTKAAPTFDANYVVDEFGEIFVTATVNEDATLFVSFKVDNDTDYENIEDGVAKYRFNLYDKDTHNLTVTYKGDGNYLEASKNLTVTLTKDFPVIEIINASVNEYGAIVVNANITKGISGNVTFEFRNTDTNKTMTVPIAIGENGTIEYDELEAFEKGFYDVGITYGANDKYYAAYAFTYVDVNKTVPTMDYTVKVVGGEVSIAVTLPANITGNLTVIYPSGYNETVNITNGSATINAVFMKETGDLAITASFAGNDQYYAKEAIIGFVIKEATLVKTSAVSVVYTNNAKVTVKLTNLVTNKAIAGAPIEITVNGKTYKGNTDKNGKAVITIPANMIPKKYTAKVVYKGTDRLESDFDEINFIVKKAKAKITAKKKTFKKSKKVKKYTITLKDNKGKAIKKAKVSIKVGKKTFTAKTNAKGKAVFKLKKLTKKAKYNAKVTFKGNKYFNKVTKKVKITIK